MNDIDRILPAILKRGKHKQYSDFKTSPVSGSFVNIRSSSSKKTCVVADELNNLSNGIHLLLISGESKRLSAFNRISSQLSTYVTVNIRKNIF